MSKMVRLSDVADLTVGFVGTMAEHYVDNGVPFLRSLNVKPFSIVRFRFVSELQNIEPKTMEREFCSIIIDKRKKKEILNELCTLGIDESYVYPELQYTAKKIKETYL